MNHSIVTTVSVYVSLCVHKSISQFRKAQSNTFIPVNNILLQEKWNMKLDTKSEIFQNLNGALGKIILSFMFLMFWGLESWVHVSPVM